MKKQKSLLIVLYYYYPYISGLSIYAKRIAEGLVKKNIQVTILTSRYDNSLPKQEVINGVKIIRRPVLFKLGKGVIMPTLPFDIIFQSKKYDLINPMLPMAEIGLISNFVPKKKLIISYICDLYLGDKFLSKIITYISFLSMHIALLRTKNIYALSFDYLKNSKMKKYITKATAVYPIINANDFTPQPNSKDFFKKHLGINSSTKKIGFVGRIVYEKGIGYLLESIKYINKELDDFKIIIVGEYKNVAGGSIKDELDLFIKKFPNKIIFTGYLNDNDLKAFYSGIDVLVLPSIDPLEAFGMVQVEAMLCGAPVVASNLPGVREVVNKTGYGLISKVKDSKDIADKVLTIINNRKQYAPSRDKVIQIFNPDDSLNIYINQFQQD